MIPPKIFVSYSWKPTHNKIKVIELAERLSSDFVHVILDDWDLKEGQDKYEFMEKMVNDPDVKRVLIICNKEYSDKANSKTGGVGIESLIVSDEIYTQASQTKFIPIIFEYDSKGNPCVPTFVKSRIFIDLSTEITFEDNYEQLLRNIFEKPSSKRPPLGTIPAFLQTEELIFLPTAHKVTTIKNALINEKKNTPLYIQDYLDTYINSLQLFSISDSEITHINFDEIILKKIEEMKVLRDDFINFLEVYISNSLTIDYERLHDFFEKLLIYYFDNHDSYYQSNVVGYLKSDNFRFFYYELFLTFTAIMLEKERFTELAYILQTPFIITTKKNGETKQFDFSVFRQYVPTLNEHRNKKLQLNKKSLTAETIKQRATEKYPFDILIDADILLYYLSLLLFAKDSTKYGECWFPETGCYRSFGIKILPKTISERYFNRVKVLFGITTKEELLLIADGILKSGVNKLGDYNYRIPNVIVGLCMEKMCSLK
jgi:hypothetical protein